ncbi:hypothetical protein Q3G72_031383 [Acer saccharum]|nr:hypothetical protein Q3G72_031383 [Acer saccharum]
MVVVMSSGGVVFPESTKQKPLCGYGFSYNEEKQRDKTFQGLSSAELELTQPVEGSQRQDTISNNENEEY